MRGYIEKKPRLNSPSGRKAKTIFLDFKSATIAQKKHDDFFRKNPAKKTCKFTVKDGKFGKLRIV